MKHFLLSLMATVACAGSMSAQLAGNGYYRVENYVTERFVYITDNKGSVNIGTTSVDALAIQLWKGQEKANCDPATVLYFDKHSTVSSSIEEYDIKAQGTGIYNILEHYVNIRKNSDGTYFAYGTSSGGAKYLGDANSSDAAEGTMSSEATGDRRKWYIKPISTTGDNYFGIKPTLTVQNKYYQPFYADFPMSAYSSGVKIMAVKQYGYGMAVVEEVKGTIPARTACYIECGSTNPSNNRMTVGGSGTAIANNPMGGVFFENYMKTHLNLTPYNPKTMRLLGKMPDGSLGFVTGTIEYLPANQSYLNVPEGAPANIKIVTKAEYDRIVAGFPTSISVDKTDAKLYVGNTLQLTANIQPANATDKSVVWSSSNPAVATVSASGLVTAAGKGTATITATTVNGHSAVCKVTVAPANPEKITLGVTSLKLYVGESKTVTATLEPADVQNKTVTWTSSNPSVASVDAQGSVTAKAAGTATVTARTANNLTAEVAVTVAPVYPTAITLNVTEKYIHAYETFTLTAKITPSDVKDKTLTWKSSNESVAVVDAEGNVTGAKEGTAEITVSSPGGAKATCKFTVMVPLPESVKLNFDHLIMEVDDTRYLKALILPEGAYSSVTWSSSNSAIASVSSIGQITALAPGEVTITATTTNGITGSCAITVLKKGTPATEVIVSPAKLELSPGHSARLTAEIKPANVSNPFLTWTSNNEKVATVDQDGEVTAVGEGIAIVYAQCGSISGSAVVKVTIPAEPVLVTEIILDREEIDGEVGAVFNLEATVLPENATDKRVVWASSNQGVASVSSTGSVTIRSIGQAVITATAADGSNVSAACYIYGKSEIESIFTDGSVRYPVYTVSGVLLRADADLEFVRSLAPGVYVIGHNKVLIK